MKQLFMQMLKMQVGTRNPQAYTITKKKVTSKSKNEHPEKHGNWKVVNAISIKEIKMISGIVLL